MSKPIILSPVKFTKEFNPYYVDITNSRRRVSEFSSQYPKIGEAIRRLRETICASPKITSRFTNVKEYSDFAVAEILHLNKGYKLFDNMVAYGESAISPLISATMPYEEREVKAAIDNLFFTIDEVLKSNSAVAGKSDDLFEAIKSAIDINPASPQYHYHLITMRLSEYANDRFSRVKSLGLLKRLADMGYAPAQYSFAEVCKNLLADGVALPLDINDKMIFNYYKRAVDFGYVPAHDSIATCYKRGVGVGGKDNDRAFFHYDYGARSGDVDAQFNRAICFQGGTGVDIDFSQALHSYKLAADQGDIDAQIQLAICYRDRIGVDEENLKEAMRYFEMALDVIDNADVRVALGEVQVDYADSILLLDSTKAILLYARAASNQNADAIQKLAVIEHIIPDIDNTMLTALEIIEIIDAMRYGGRIGQDDFEAIGEVVEISAPILANDGVGAICRELFTVPGIDIVNSMSCQKIDAVVMLKMAEDNLIDRPAAALIIEGDIEMEKMERGVSDKVPSVSVRIESSATGAAEAVKSPAAKFGGILGLFKR